MEQFTYVRNTEALVKTGQLSLCCSVEWWTFVGCGNLAAVSLEPHHIVHEWSPCSVHVHLLRNWSPLEVPCVGLKVDARMCSCFKQSLPDAKEMSPVAFEGYCSRQTKYICLSSNERNLGSILGNVAFLVSVFNCLRGDPWTGAGVKKYEFRLASKEEWK